MGGTPVRRSVLVFTEGRKTEPSYLVGWWRALRDHLDLKISPDHGTPATLVRHAAAAKARAARDAKKGRGDQYDAIWCVFDVDEHPDIDAAIRDAERMSVGIAVSNPCIELWFLLHWRDQTAYLDRHAARAAVVPMVGATKSLNAQAVQSLITRHDDAPDRARALDHMHEGNGSSPRSNPSSGAWVLIDDLRRR